MNYLKYTFSTDPKNNEPLIALLGELSFEAFQELENGFDAWVPEKETSEKLDSSVNELKQLFEFSFEKELIKHQNWNAIWESDFQPIVVKDFCGIRADFHNPIPNVKEEIIINPKMAFGTGHHETTFMMIEMMEKLAIKHKNVFDFGCGTGILAILASKLGANKIDAIDIEIASYENSLENIRINETENVAVYHGTLAKLVENKYDIILANINRHVILETFAPLNNMLPPEGILVISGILTTDQKLIEQEAIKAGFEIKTTLKKNSWICMLLTPTR